MADRRTPNMRNPASSEVLPAGKLPGDLLSRLVGTYATHDDPSVLVGPGRGRDAAVVSIGNAHLAVKSDPITFASESAASYLVDVNANDLACLGATPRWLLVTMLLPTARTTAEQVESQFRELASICAARGISLVGGHTEITPAVNWPVLVGALCGDVPAGRLLRPGGAQPGDRVLLTKGLAIEGTALLARERRLNLIDAVGAEIVARAAAFLTDPGISVVRDAGVLLAAGGVTALHDPTEGGLAVGAREIAEAAGCGVTLNLSAVPILPETAAIAGALGLDPLGLLASGSLLAAASPARAADLIAAGRTAGFDVTDIGEISAEPGSFLLATGGREVPLPEFDSDELTRVLS